MTNGVNISGPCIAFLSGPLQIFVIWYVDLKTMPVVPGKSLWRSRKVGEVGSRAPHQGPAYRRCTASLVMHAHCLGGTRDYQHVWSVARTSSPEQLSRASRRLKYRPLT